MEEIWPQLSTWVATKKRFALATVVAVKRSSPRGVGSCLAVSEDGSEFIGSVSAGCVENEVIEAAKLCIADGDTRWLEFGPEIGYPWEVSLSCGGKIRVRVEAFFGDSADPENQRAAAALRSLLDAQESGLLLSQNGNHILFDAGGAAHGSLDRFAQDTIETAFARWKKGLPTEEIASDHGPILYRLLAPKPRLFIVGSVHIATHLVQIAAALNYETIVIDPRSAYATPGRFIAPPDQLLCEQPEAALARFELRPNDSAVVLTHDPKIDDPALIRFAQSKCGYIGALGSRKSHESRLKRLASAGLSEPDRNRIKGPVGLDIGSRTPAEIAVSIVAEIIARKRKPIP